MGQWWNLWSCSKYIFMASFSTSDDCRSYNKVHRKLYFLIIRLYLQPTARSQLPRSFDMQLSCINISEYQDTFRYMHKYIHIYMLSYLQIYIYIYLQYGLALSIFARLHAGVGGVGVGPTAGDIMRGLASQWGRHRFRCSRISRNLWRKSEI